jgi:hypothetical protein
MLKARRLLDHRHLLVRFHQPPPPALLSAGVNQTLCAALAFEQQRILLVVEWIVRVDRLSYG